MDEALANRINQLPEWIRDYIHRVETFIGAPEVQELIQLRDERLQLIALIEELKTTIPRLQDHLRMVHADCGGIVGGELGKPFKCADCGKVMTAFASADDEAVVAAARVATERLEWLETVRERAHQIWLERQVHGTAGSAETDWLQAERGADDH